MEDGPTASEFGAKQEVTRLTMKILQLHPTAAPSLSAWHSRWRGVGHAKTPSGLQVSRMAVGQSLDLYARSIHRMIVKCSRTWHRASQKCDVEREHMARN